MIFTRLFILDYITLNFCGVYPCVPCPDHGKCTDKLLICEKPYRVKRYDCVERGSLLEQIQDYTLEAELYMLQRVFLSGNYSITELDLFLQTDASNIIFDSFIHSVQSGHSKVLYWTKSNTRNLVIRLPYAYTIGFLLYLDSHWYIYLPITFITLIIIVTKYLYSLITKIKID